MRGQGHDHVGHQRREGETGETGPYDPPRTRVTVDFRQDIAEHIGDRKEQHARPKSQRAQKWRIDLGYLCRSDEIRTDENRHKGNHHEFAVTIIAGHGFRYVCRVRSHMRPLEILTKCLVAEASLARHFEEANCTRGGGVERFDFPGHRNGDTMRRGGDE